MIQSHFQTLRKLIWKKEIIENLVQNKLEKKITHKIMCSPVIINNPTKTRPCYFLKA